MLYVGRKQTSQEGKTLQKNNNKPAMSSAFLNIILNGTLSLINALNVFLPLKKPKPFHLVSLWKEICRIATLFYNMPWFITKGVSTVFQMRKK